MSEMTETFADFKGDPGKEIRACRGATRTRLLSAEQGEHP